MGAAGSSGGGSINIFTDQSTGVDQLGIITNTKYNELLGNANKSGGIGVNNSTGGAGGNGTVNIGEIRNGKYYDLKEIIEQDKEVYKNSVTKTGDSILSILDDKSLKSGYYYFSVNGENYPVHLYTYDGNQHFIENQTFGDAKDVATENDYAQNMVIVKVNGDLIIDEGVTVGPYYTEYGGPKGFTLYVTGKLTNNGTIDNSHGAKAEGQNVYLWKNADGTYEYVPAEGATGATTTSTGGYKKGMIGSAGTGRQTGGGGSGYLYSGTSTGGTGTSYSGGAGAGNLYSGTTVGSSVGGAGGNGQYAGGAGNPGGSGNNKGANGTGGLLVIYAAGYENFGIISAVGSNGGTGGTMGVAGSSGGGSINIFYNTGSNDGNSSVKGGTINGGAGTTTYTQIHLISIASDYTYPMLTTSGIIDGYHTVTLYKLPAVSRMMYSVDDGNTWLDYINPFIVQNGVTILAKGIKTDNQETAVISYNTVASNDSLSTVVYDGSKESKVSIPAGTSQVFTTNNLADETLRIYTTGTVASDSYIKLFDADGNELTNVSLTSGLTTISIPSNSAKAIVYSGSATLELVEISLRDKKVENNIPIIDINTANWASSKTVDITYPTGYKNEYSLDLGSTWNEYLSPITVDKPITVLARVVDNDKVISSSSYTITKIDAVVPTIELDIPDSITIGSKYNLPTSYTVGISGGTPKCTVNDTDISNTESLELGTYTIECSITNGLGVSATSSKNITIVDANAAGEVILSNNTLINAEPTLTTTSLEAGDADGLYVSTDTNSGKPTYYFRGNVDNNYVSFAGFTWRIVRINEDGTIRMIMQDGINNNTKYIFNSNYNNYTYMYYSNSAAKTTLDNWYNDNIGSNSDLSSKVVSGNYFCEQAKVKYSSSYTSGSAIMTVYTSYVPNFKCETDGNGYGLVNTNVGLITYDEIAYAGGYYGFDNDKIYLNNNSDYKSMSPAGVDSYSARISGSRFNTKPTSIADYYVFNADSTLRLVINLKADTQFTGNGTLDNMYMVK